MHTDMLNNISVSNFHFDMLLILQLARVWSSCHDI